METTDWREAQAKEKELIAQASAARLVPQSRQFSRLGFTEESERHCDDRIPHLSPRSLQTEKERLKPLKKYFGNTPLTRITADTLRAYIAERKKSGVANKTINLEIGVVRGVLKAAKRWYLLADDIKPLPTRHQIGRALTAGEKLRLEKTASANPDWENARYAMLLALNTTMRSCELKGLQWRDVDLLERAITVRQSKTDAGRRSFR